MGFFNFLQEIAPYAEDPKSVRRLNMRHRMIIGPLADEIAGEAVLDLAAHDGRWAHAFAAAGARDVLGIEGRQELIDRYAHYPASAVKDRVSLRAGDIFDGVDAEIAQGNQYGVIGVLGIFYHIMDHFRLLKQLRKLGPKMVIVDSDFALAAGAVIVLAKERVDKPLHAIAQIEGQETTVIGIPSFKAMEVMAEVLDYDCTWLNWNRVPLDKRGPLGDYYRTDLKCRGTCILRPRKPGADA
jgi:hypothetical protein